MVVMKHLRYFFSELAEHELPVEYHVYMYHLSSMCRYLSNMSMIWTLIKNHYNNRIIRNRNINKWSLKSPQPQCHRGHFYTCIRMSWHGIIIITSLWPSSTIWRHRSGSTLAQVMVWCLMAPNHYLNQCWLIIGKVHWHSSEGKVHGR